MTADDGAVTGGTGIFKLMLSCCAQLLSQVTRVTQADLRLGVKHAESYGVERG